jgi:hypothetical protein
MSLLNYFSNIGTEHLSVEVNSDGCWFPSDQVETLDDPDLNSLFDFDLFTNEINIAGVCDSADLVGKMR